MFAIRSKRTGVVAAAVAAVLALWLGVPSSAAATTTSFIGVGSKMVAMTVSGGRYIYVAKTGSDSVSQYQPWAHGNVSYGRYNCLSDPNYIESGVSSQTVCPEPTASAPLATIQLAVRVARPGDVIVVRAGVYSEAIGWSAVRGTASAPIVMEANPGERVDIDGTLIMRSPDYWTIQGFHFNYNRAIQSGQAVVALAGGQHWNFINNEVDGSAGVANLLIESDTATSSTVAAKTAAAPSGFNVSGNCIHTNNGNDAQGTDHNIYMMSSIYSTGGMIEHNFLAGAPRGSNIKAAASSPSTASDSPNNVLIAYNTMLYAASGVTVGLSAQGISIEHNLIALPMQSQSNDGAIKTYQLAAPGKNAVKDTLLYGYASAIHEDFGVTSHIFTARNVSTPVSFTGSVANCSVKPTSSTILNQYGQYAGQ